MKPLRKYERLRKVLSAKTIFPLSYATILIMSWFKSEEDLLRD
jgi:hypothetical protein